MPLAIAKRITGTGYLKISKPAYYDLHMYFSEGQMEDHRIYDDDSVKHMKEKSLDEDRFIVSVVLPESYSKDIHRWNGVYQLEGSDGSYYIRKDRNLIKTKEKEEQQRFFQEIKERIKENDFLIIEEKRRKKLSFSRYKAKDFYFRISAINHELHYGIKTISSEAYRQIRTYINRFPEEMRIGLNCFDEEMEAYYVTDRNAPDPRKAAQEVMSKLLRLEQELIELFR